MASSFDPIDVTQFTFEETKAAVDAANDRSTYVMAHIFADKSTQLAVKTGVLSIEHGHLRTSYILKLTKKKGGLSEHATDS